MPAAPRTARQTTAELPTPTGDSSLRPKRRAALAWPRSHGVRGGHPLPGERISPLRCAPEDRPAWQSAPSVQRPGGLTVRAESFWPGTAGSSSGSSSSSGTHILRRRQRRRRARSGSGKRRSGTLLGMSLPLPTPAWLLFNLSLWEVLA